MVGTKDRGLRLPSRPAIRVTGRRRSRDAFGSDGHDAARVEDEEAVAGNVPGDMIATEDSALL